MTPIDFEASSSNVKVTVTLSWTNGFRSITQEQIGWGTSNLKCRLVRTNRWPILSVRSEGQGHSDLGLKWFPLKNRRTLEPRHLNLEMQWSWPVGDPYEFSGPRSRLRWNWDEKQFQINTWKTIFYKDISPYKTGNPRAWPILTRGVKFKQSGYRTTGLYQFILARL